MRATWTLLAAAAALSACADAPAPGDQSAEQCFWPTQVSGFSDAGPDKALVRIGFKETYEITLSPGCPDVNYAMNLGIRARSGGRVCSGRDVELVVPEASGNSGRRCLVRTIRRLSPEEAAASRGETPRQR